MNDNVEIWNDVLGLETFEISNLGNMRSKDGAFNTSATDLRNFLNQIQVQKKTESVSLYKKVTDFIQNVERSSDGVTAYIKNYSCNSDNYQTWEIHIKSEPK